MADLRDQSEKVEYIRYCTIHDSRRLDDPLMLDRCIVFVWQNRESAPYPIPNCVFVDAALEV